MLKNNVFLSSVLALGLSAFVVGCSSQSDLDKSAQPTKSTAIVNTHCPIMGGEVDPEVKTTWKGKTVGFCCDVCIPEWNGLSDEVKEKKLANPPEDGMSEADGE